MARLGSRARLAAAIAVSAALVLLAPFFGEVRRVLRATFPSHFVPILGAAAALIVCAVLVAALVRIRDRRASRYAAVATALACAVAYSLWTAGSDPQVNAVERFHFLQYGVITYLFYRAWRPLEDVSVFLLPVLAALIVGTAEEWYQWFIPARVGEMRDVFLNGVAIGCGTLFSAGIDPPRLASRLKPGSARRLGRLGAAAVLVFGAFVHSVHLGHEITDPEAGTFRSRYTARQLLALARDRQQAWREAPPVHRPPRVSREDQYMSEGLLHVQERNRRWASGGIDAAWRENLILERFYAPVLDAPSYVSATGHRWPAEQRADAGRRRAATGNTQEALRYVSRADGGFIRTWRRWTYWLAVLALAGAVLLAGRLAHRGSNALSSSPASRTAHRPAGR